MGFPFLGNSTRNDNHRKSICRILNALKVTFCYLLATPLSYADDAINPSKPQSMESIVGTPRYNPSSVSDSVRAVIEHTGKMRESNAMSDIAQDIKKNQPTEAYAEEADTINNSKNQTMRTQSSNVEKCLGSRVLRHRISNVN